MDSKGHHYLSGAQQAALVILRTLIGWHFLYEGYYKLMLPAWGSDGKPLPPWTSAGYLKSASGPLARVFQWMIDAGWIGWMDMTVKIRLLSIGLSLILGLLTRVGCYGALFFLAMFYLLAIPLAGIPQPGNEGTYMLVNKTLIEAAAVGETNEVVDLMLVHPLEGDGVELDAQSCLLRRIEARHNLAEVAPTRDRPELCGIERIH